MVKIEELAIDLLARKMSVIDFLSFFEENPVYLKCFNKYALKNLYSTLIDVNKLKERIPLNINIKIFILQLFETFLIKRNIKYEILDEDFLLFNKLQEQCPEWVQSDLQLFISLYPNLKLLMKNNSFCEKVNEDFKYIKDKPDWLQNPEWPVVDGVIYVFEGQNITVDELAYDECSITYTFFNPITNEKKLVIQCD